MAKFFIYWCLLISALNTAGQNKIISVSTEAEVQGGKDALMQVLETQLTLPKLILIKDFEKDVTVYFELDSASNAVRVTFDKGLNNLLMKEIVRVLKFLKFNKKTSISETPFEYFLVLNLSTAKYNKYTKQRTKFALKNNLKADSSYVVFTKADKSPEYYKKGDDGLAEFIMGEIEYPSVAREKSIQGTVIVEFTVETNGFVSGLNVRQGVNGGCTEEALRILKQTRWQPAIANGKYVRYKMTYPITFNLQNSFKDNSTPRQDGGY